MGARLGLRCGDDLHRSISIIFDRLDLNLPSPHDCFAPKMRDRTNAMKKRSNTAQCNFLFLSSGVNASKTLINAEDGPCRLDVGGVGSWGMLDTERMR